MPTAPATPPSTRHPRDQAPGEYCGNCDHMIRDINAPPSASRYCRCRFCEGHEARTSNTVCTVCRRCIEGCGCSCVNAELPMSRIYINSPLNFHDGKPCALNPSKRYLSAEIEVAFMESNVRGVRDTVQRWNGSIVTDGSIPNGFEINTAPAGADAFVRQIDEITAELEKGHAAINTACGLHVHIDARDFTYYDLRRLILFYAKIEPALYRLVAKSRRDNRFCIPCADRFKQAVEASAMPKELKKNIFKSVYGSPPSLLLNKKQGSPLKKYANGRYSALNIHSWFYRGTIECRMHHGTITAKGIRSWAVMWARLLDVSLTLSEANIRALPDDGLTALLQVTEKMPETHTWIINRALFFAKQENIIGNAKIPGFALTCNQIRNMRKAESVLNESSEDCVLV